MNIEGLKIGYGTFEDGSRGAQLFVAVSGQVFNENDPVATAVLIASAIIAQSNTIKVREVATSEQADGDSGESQAAQDDLLKRLQQRMSEGN